MGMIESMERRLLMAGNVGVRLVGDRLRITGDAQSNAFTMTVILDTLTTFADIHGMKGTTINGKPSVQLDEVTSGEFSVRSVLVRMGAGDDQIQIEPYIGDFRLGVDLGSGNDVFKIGGGATGFFATDIYAGAGDDAVSLQQVAFDGRLRIFGDAGSDQIELFSVNAYRGMDISDSGAAARIQLTDVTSSKPSIVSLGNRSDQLSIVRGTFRQLNVYTRDGVDMIAVRGSVFESSSAINSGAGDDTFDLTGEGINLSVIQ